MGGAITLGLILAGLPGRRYQRTAVAASLLGFLPFGGMGTFGAILLFAFVASVALIAGRLYRRFLGSVPATA